MPKKIADKSKKFALIVAEDWVHEVDEWRRRQPDLPNFSEAVRRLTEEALDHDEKKKKPKKR